MCVQLVGRVAAARSLFSRYQKATIDWIHVEILYWFQHSKESRQLSNNRRECSFVRTDVG